MVIKASGSGPREDCYNRYQLHAWSCVFCDARDGPGRRGGFGSALVSGRGVHVARTSVARELGPLLANVSGAGVVLLWVSGLILVSSGWDGFGSIPGLFWLKFLFVLTLTAAVGAIHMTFGRSRCGDVAARGMAAEARTGGRKLGPARGIVRRHSPSG